MSEHNYKFNVTMTCGGCSGAVERVLKKLDGKTTSTPGSAATNLFPFPPLPPSFIRNTFTESNSSTRRQILQRLSRLPDRGRGNRIISTLRNSSGEDQKDGENGK